MSGNKGFALIWVMVFLGVVLGGLVYELGWLGVELKLAGEARERFLMDEEARYHVDLRVGKLQESIGMDNELQYESYGHGFEVEDLSMKAEGIGLAVDTVRGGWKEDWRTCAYENLKTYDNKESLMPVITGVYFGIEPNLETGLCTSVMKLRLWNPWDVGLSGEYSCEVDLRGRGSLQVGVVHKKDSKQKDRISYVLPGGRMLNGVFKAEWKAGEEKEIELFGDPHLKYLDRGRSLSHMEVVFLKLELRGQKGFSFKISKGSRFQQVEGVYSGGSHSVAVGGSVCERIGVVAELKGRDVTKFNERASVQKLKGHKLWDMNWVAGEGRGFETEDRVAYRFGRLCDVDVYNRWDRGGLVFGERGGLEQEFWDKYRFGEEQVEGMFNVNSREVLGWERVLGDRELAEAIAVRVGEYGDFRGLGEFVESGVIGKALEDCGRDMRQGEVWEKMVGRVNARGDTYMIWGYGGGEKRYAKKIQRMPDRLKERLGRRFKRVGSRWIDIF